MRETPRFRPLRREAVGDEPDHFMVSKLINMATDGVGNISLNVHEGLLLGKSLLKWDGYG